MDQFSILLSTVAKYLATVESKIENWSMLNIDHNPMLL